MSYSAKSADSSASLSIVSSSGKRMQPRVDLPLRVEFENGQEALVRDWSVTGFSIADSGLLSREGAIHRVRLHLSLADCDIAVEADAKVSWRDGEHARGFRFVGLTPEKARILDHFIQSRFEGDAVVVGGLPIAHDMSGGVTPERRPRAWLHRTVHVGKLGLLAGVVLAGAVFIVARLLTVTSDFAAVSADLQQLHAPAAGFLQSETLTAGARLTLGQRIGLIQPVTTPQMRLATETQIAAMQTTLDQQNVALVEAKAGFETFLQASRTDLQEASAARAMLDEQVAAEDRIEQRTIALNKTGVVADERMDQERQAVLNLRRLLSAARDSESAMRQKLANAEAGRFSSDGRSTQKSPADAAQAVRETEASLARLTSMRAAIDQPLPLLSPCDCTVAALTATPGAYIAAGTAVADLAKDGRGTVTVDALVQNARLNLVRQDQTVTVYFANRIDGLPGRVVGINFNPANTGRIGLPTALRTLDDYGLMTLAIDRPGAGLPSGLPATVMVPVAWQALLTNVPGASWLTDAAAQAAAKLRPLEQWAVTARGWAADLLNKVHDRARGSLRAHA